MKFIIIVQNLSVCWNLRFIILNSNNSLKYDVKISIKTNNICINSMALFNVLL